MNYLAELPFVDIFDAKANKAFFWRVDNPLDYKCGVNGAKTSPNSSITSCRICRREPKEMMVSSRSKRIALGRALMATLSATEPPTESSAPQLRAPDAGVTEGADSPA